MVDKGCTLIQLIHIVVAEPHDHVGEAVAIDISGPAHPKVIPIEPSNRLRLIRLDPYIRI